ncbi:peptide chain release factor N(5)-glutamine methyltransferase [Lacinutrix neustonica]|uniref:peptide chain release factor N(5)-glutamine methyltransferase n=1 Tax=Lacinutrix neustonica TaxID=2980107 RepID=A0A9E8SE86_9FLAO|nr:peptide chain release factor N(5)-glutamine methyltransferase [Lacinutrix neustonica]WAC02044.1 peptide chain release factor N(5)-glutamine methyltransferase [Lacinutrix neustonica]
MRLKDLEQLFHKELDAIYGKEEVSSFFFLCTEHYYNISRLQLALDIDLLVAKEAQQPIFDALEALKTQKPIQYILGETEFYGLPFKVNENTLIPRPETEELVELILETIDFNVSTILDIGTGTGCIAISLAKHLPKTKITALDVSVEALKIAKENAAINGVQINFIEADILRIRNSEMEKLAAFNVIVSNPPYVRHLEKSEMNTNVIDNEPHVALFVDDNNPLVFYKSITQFAKVNLDVGGKLFFEINEYLGKETKHLVESYGFKNVEVIKDMFGKDRMLAADK